MHDWFALKDFTVELLCGKHSCHFFGAPWGHEVTNRLFIYWEADNSVLGCCADVVAKFNNSAWGKKLAKRASKAATTDFDRYKATVAKVSRAKSVREAFHKLKGKDSA